MLVSRGCAQVRCPQLQQVASRQPHRACPAVQGLRVLDYIDPGVTLTQAWGALRPVAGPWPACALSTGRVGRCPRRRPGATARRLPPAGRWPPGTAGCRHLPAHEHASWTSRRSTQPFLAGDRVGGGCCVWGTSTLQKGCQQQPWSAGASAPPDTAGNPSACRCGAFICCSSVIASAGHVCLSQNVSVLCLLDGSATVVCPAPSDLLTAPLPAP